MRKREYRVPVYLNRQEKEELQRKSEAACMECTRFIRMLIAGYEPRPLPDDRFYEAMDLLRDMESKLDDIEEHMTDPNLASMLNTESKKWHLFRQAIEQRYLVPARRDE